METIFLACFAFGLLFTVASVVLGAVGGGLGHSGVHLGHGGGHAAPHIGHGAAHVGHGAGEVGHGAGEVGHGPGHLAHDAHIPHEGPRGSSLPLLNASSAVGALTWFGAAGYVLLRLGDWALPIVLLAALATGAVGWYLIARFLGLILRGEVEMDPDDYRLEGTVGQVTVSIPAGGTGEVVFSKVDTRRSEAARALGGVAIPRGTEVVITSYQGGFATVQPWDEFVGARALTESDR